MWTSDLIGELGLKFLSVFGSPQILKTFSQSNWLVVRLILAAEDIPQQVDVGKLLSNWAGRGSVTFCPKTRIVCFHKFSFLQGAVRLWPAGRVFNSISVSLSHTLEVFLGQNWTNKLSPKVKMVLHQDTLKPKPYSNVLYVNFIIYMLSSFLNDLLIYFVEK